MSLLQIQRSMSTHDHTLISRKNRKIEAELTRRLDAIVNLIKGEHDAGRIVSSGQARSILESEVYDVLRSSIQQSYQLGIDYVTGLLGRQNYFSRHDINTVGDLATDYNNRFWGRLDTLIVDKDLTDANMGITSEKTNNFVVVSLAADLTTRSLNEATVAKTREVVENTTSDADIIPNPDPDPTLIPNQLQGFTGLGVGLLVAKQIELRLAARNAALFGLPAGTQPPRPGYKYQFQWVITLTDRTCRQCKRLNGLRWDIGDMTMPTPGGISNNGGLHTHWNCRCRLILIETRR